ncbi:uncharacterized protein LOC114359495 [Ostrinia furnacalis]|uniref:uncharacterized protein LOC114359495 n=1 Tax=Ostrinia furnacalis TaxID=93504 RepID=UPI00103BD9C7|nr:uncharacterized protein LOC114359495 [Ostrinia furnacalis]
MASNFGLHCRYYAGKTLEWMVNNKMIVFLGLLSFCLFVSTLAMAGQRNRALAQVEELKTSTVAPTTEKSPETTTNPVTDTTNAPATNVPATDVPTTDAPASDVPDPLPEGDGNQGNASNESDKGDKNKDTNLASRWLKLRGIA